MTTLRHELSRAILDAGQLSFMVAQVGANLDYLSDENYYRYEQEIVCLRHDILSVVRSLTDLNSRIMKEDAE